jgi:hypothetical protein
MNAYNHVLRMSLVTLVMLGAISVQRVPPRRVSRARRPFVR